MHLTKQSITNLRRQEVQLQNELKTMDRTDPAYFQKLDRLTEVMSKLYSRSKPIK